ncbi:cytoplasmic dynein 2 heavy chain 1-like [Haemaphysalis longicornis]
MSAVARDERIVLVCSIAETHGLDALADQLGRFLKALHQHMEDKRSRFARFYFLGDEELLQVLGNRPSAVEPHLRKLFAAVHSVEWGPDCVTALFSPEGERLQLERPVTLTQDPEVWLGELSQQMRLTLQAMLRRCLEDPTADVSYPVQVVCLAEWIRFTGACESALESGSLAQLHAGVRGQLAALMGAPRALLLDAMHRVAVVQELLEHQVSSPRAWHWQKQLR